MTSQRYLALDSMRGFVIIWELIMPAFMFMVGASLPFALARNSLGSTVTVILPTQDFLQGLK